MGRDLSADVVVLGGGLVGSALAYELACGDVSVALVDASRTGRASDAGAGIASPETFNDPDDQWFAFGAEASRHLRTLISRLDGDCADLGPDTFAECGSLVVALAEHEERWFAELLDLSSVRNAAVAEVSVSDAKSMFPPIGPVWRAFYNPSACRIDGRRLCSSLRTAAQERGVTLVTGDAVGIERSGDRVKTVRLSDAVVNCGAFVVAAGAWSSKVAEWIGADVPVAPTKGQIVHVVLPQASRGEGSVPTSDLWPIVQPVLNFYLVPWPGGRVACGGTFEAEAGFDDRPTAAAMRDLLRECLVIAPGLADAALLEVRVGLRPMSADGRPILGRLPGMENVHVCTGHGANGLLLGPYSAALVAAGLLGDPSCEVTVYPASRFSGRT